MLRMVRHYWAIKGQPNKKTIISRKNGYHGSTVAGASLGGMTYMHEQGDLPIPGITHIPQPYWFGEGGDMSPEEFGIWAANQLEEKIRKLGVDLRSNAIVHKIETGADGKVTALHYLAPNRAATRLTAKVYVLAGHGFETPKLMLMNNLGARSGMVGRNLMVHPTIDMTLLSSEPLWAGRGQNIHGAIMQRRNQPDRTRIPSTRYDLLNNPPTVGIAETALSERKIGAALDDEIHDRSARIFTFEALTEDLPDKANGISLNPGFKDSLGLPILRSDKAVSAMPTVGGLFSKS